MEWLLAGLMPDVAVALGGVVDGQLVVEVRIIDVEGDAQYFACYIPLEDVKAKLQESLNATRE